MDAKDIATEIIGIPILIIGILTIFTDWPFMQILAISLACGFVIAVTDLVRMKSAEILSEQPEAQQSETPTTSTPRKFPVKIIALIIVIAVIAIPLGIFLISGDIGDKIEKAKSVIPKEAPVIPVFADNFSDSKTENDYRISGGNAKIENGKMIIEAESATFTIDRDFTDCDKITVKFSVKKIAGSGCSSAFSCFIEDGYGEDGDGYPTGYYDGVSQILLQEKQRNPSFSQFKNGGIWPDKEYQVALKRTAESDKVNLRFIVNGKVESKEYQIPLRKPVQIGIGFISENNAKFEIDNLKIYAYTTT